jgi:hypothetical protein
MLAVLLAAMSTGGSGGAAAAQVHPQLRRGGGCNAPACRHDDALCRQRWMNLTLSTRMMTTRPRRTPTKLQWCVPFRSQSRLSCARIRQSICHPR